MRFETSSAAAIMSTATTDSRGSSVRRIASYAARTAVTVGIP